MLRAIYSQVGWIKADTKAIQAIHDHVITHNPRVSVSRSDNTMWNLHIKGVELEDAGLYMCQINTDPMKSQVSLSYSHYMRANVITVLINFINTDVRNISGIEDVFFTYLFLISSRQVIPVSRNPGFPTTAKDYIGEHKYLF